MLSSVIPRWRSFVPFWPWERKNTAGTLDFVHSSRKSKRTRTLSQKSPENILWKRWGLPDALSATTIFESMRCLHRRCSRAEALAQISGEFNHHPVNWWSWPISRVSDVNHILVQFDVGVRLHVSHGICIMVCIMVCCCDMLHIICGMILCYSEQGIVWHVWWCHAIQFECTQWIWR